MLIIQAANITLMVSDLDQAVAFYTQVLGFELKNRFGQHWADIQAPGMMIGLHPTSEAVEPGKSLQIGLRLTDLAAARQELETKNIKTTAGNDTSVKLAYFTDPDGNQLYLVEESW